MTKEHSEKLSKQDYKEVFIDTLFAPSVFIPFLFLGTLIAGLIGTCIVNKIIGTTNLHDADIVVDDNLHATTDFDEGFENMSDCFESLEELEIVDVDLHINTVPRDSIKGKVWKSLNDGEYIVEVRNCSDKFVFIDTTLSFKKGKETVDDSFWHYIPAHSSSYGLLSIPEGKGKCELSVEDTYLSEKELRNHLNSSAFNLDSIIKYDWHEDSKSASWNDNSNKKNVALDIKVKDTKHDYHIDTFVLCYAGDELVGMNEITILTGSRDKNNRSTYLNEDIVPSNVKVDKVVLVPSYIDIKS